MSSKKNTASKSKAPTNNDEANSVGDEHYFNSIAVEETLRTFNEYEAKMKVVETLLSLAESIEEEVVPPGADGEEEQKSQKLKIPSVNKLVTAKGDLISRAIAVIEAWSHAQNSPDTRPPSAGDDQDGEEAAPRSAQKTQLPLFSHDEIYESKHFNKRDQVIIKVQDGDWVGTSGLARLVLLQTMAQLDPSCCAKIDQNGATFDMVESDAPYSCLLDDIQFTDIKPYTDPINVADAMSQSSLKLKQIFHLRFVFTRDLEMQMRLEAEEQEHQQALEEKKRRQQEEEHAKRYAIVEKIRAEIAERDATEQMSLVDSYALKAEQEFRQIPMKELKASGNFTCPPKYLLQRDTPLEVPIECIRKLCDAMDTDFDDRVSLQELIDYIKVKELPFTEGIEEMMFNDAIRGRGFINEKQRLEPLSHEEVAASVRGRHRWDTQTKSWEVFYRPYRNYWIVLLLTVNKRIFALPMPKIIPTKIVAQYEMEEEYQHLMAMSKINASQGANASMTQGMNSLQSTSGMQQQTTTISSLKKPTFQRNLNKNEANIQPDKGSTIKIASRKEKKVEPNAFETQINGRMQDGGQMNTYPKFTFASKETYEQAVSLSTKIPHWKTQAENPINQFIPACEQTYKSETEEVQKMREDREVRNMRLTGVGNRDRPLQLAGTMALSKRTMSPLSKLRETRGMITLKRVPDNIETKIAQAKNEVPKAGYEFKNLQPHEFKNYDTLAFQQIDFDLNNNVSQMENPHGLSAFDTRPKFIALKERAREAKETEEAGLADKVHWVRSHALPMKHVPITQSLRDKYSKAQQENTQFLEKEKWESAYLLLARTIEDNLVVGKPNFNPYVKPIKVEDKNKTFSGAHQPHKVLS